MALNLADKKAVMTAAMSKPVTMVFGSKTAANNYRLECYGLRGQAKKQSKRINLPSELAFGTTPWDLLAFRVTQVKTGWLMTISEPTEESLGIVT